MATKSFLVMSNLVTIYDWKSNKRLREPYYGERQYWTTYDSPLQNFSNAVKTLRKAMLLTHQGFVVYRQVLLDGKFTKDVMPLYQFKWGTDGKPFEAFKPLGWEWKHGNIK